jgi:uncharacterized membrane protein
MVAALALLAASLLLPALLRGNWIAWVCLPLVIGGLWAIQHSASPVLALYIAPIIGPSFMAWVFGHTLMEGETPLIAQFVRILHAKAEPPDESVWPYARRLTLVWTMLFVAISLTNLTLAALAEPDGLLLANGIQPPVTVPQEWWSLFANVLDYVLVALFFMVEYAYRQHRFPQQPFRNFFDFLRQAGAAMPKLMKRDV